MEDFISYIRVSTKKQGDSGLGLEAQRASIVADVGQTLSEYIDVVSGTKSDRQNLLNAISACHRTGATLVVAKLDRLSRNLAFACELLKSGVKIRVVGMPEMTTLVFHILCAVAEEESRLASQRTKAALKAARERGVVLGGARDQTNRKISSRCGSGQPKDTKLSMQCTQLRQSGKTMQEIADLLNAQGYKAPKGGTLTKTHVSRIMH